MVSLLVQRADYLLASALPDRNGNDDEGIFNIIVSELSFTVDIFMRADSKIERGGSNKVFLPFHGLDSFPDVDSLLNTMFYLFLILYYQQIDRN